MSINTDRCAPGAEPTVSEWNVNRLRAWGVSFPADGCDAIAAPVNRPWDFQCFGRFHKRDGMVFAPRWCATEVH